MKRKMILASAIVSLMLVTITPVTVAPPKGHKVTARVASNAVVFKPFRILVVIDNDWRCDPDSYVDSSVYAFHDVACLLKLWSMPFDVMRLDQDKLDIKNFSDANGNAKYGVIIWNCRQERVRRNQDWSVLDEAVLNYGISLIALADTVFGLQPLKNLLGIEQDMIGTEYITTFYFNVTTSHFITRGYESILIPGNTPNGYGGINCEFTFYTHITYPSGSAIPKVLAVATDMHQFISPQLVVRDLPGTVKAVWIGGNRDLEFHQSAIMANILRNAITYCIGYSIYKTYPNTVILRMDDMGSSETAYDSPGWHYPQLTEDKIATQLIQPLLQHNAILDVMYVPGYVRHDVSEVLRSWTVDWKDPFNTRQNLISNRRGILDGIKKGVFEVQSHGWTHMQPDLESEPGPWRKNPDEWSSSDWYREFYDTLRLNFYNEPYDMRRIRDINQPTQQAHLKMSVAWIQEAFDTFPLAFGASGHKISGVDWPPKDHEWANGTGKPSPDFVVPETYTYKLAALEGFGLASDMNGYYYLGSDMVLCSMPMTRMYPLPPNIVTFHDYIPDIRSYLTEGWDIPVMVIFHDKDILEIPEFLDASLTRLEQPAPGGYAEVQSYMGQDEFIGYMHANITNTASGFAFTYDDHYCKYFSTRESHWTIQFSDRLLQQLKSQGQINVVTDGISRTEDASTYFEATMTLNITEGIETHTIHYHPPNATEPEVRDFDVTFEQEVYDIETCSNSTVLDLVFNQTAKSIRFSVNGTTGTAGFCNISIPAELLSGDFSVFMDDALLVEGVDYTASFNGTHNTLSIVYEHSSHVIEVVATNVIPDFPGWLFLPFAVYATLLALALRKRLKKQQQIS